jgi:hypothetical protein
MAMSYTARKNAVIKGLRRARQAFRISDSAGEILERELDRLIKRKTLISPESLQGVSKKYQDYAGKTANIAQALADAVTIAAV